MEEKKKLIVGARGIKNATRCVDWLEPIPALTNYHEVYFYLPSLRKDLFEKLLSKDKEVFSRLKVELFDSLTAGMFSYCITAPQFKSSSGISNYDFLPFNIQMEDRVIETFSEKKKNGYLSFIDVASGYFDRKVDATYLQSKLVSNDDTSYGWRLIPMLESLDKKAVAFYVGLYKYNRLWESSLATYQWKIDDKYGGAVFFYPPTTLIDPIQGLNSIVKGNKDDDPQIDPPDWFSTLTFPGEEDCRIRISELEIKKSSITDEIKKEEKKITSFLAFKWALRLKDEPLERAIDNIFEFLGLSIQNGKPSEEDRILTEEGVSIPIEIKGHEGGMRGRDIRQIIFRTDNAINSNGQVKGIMVVNPYCAIDPETRHQSFDNAIDKFIDKAVAHEIALIDTKTLIEVVKLVMSGDKNVQKKLLQSFENVTGVISIDVIQQQRVIEKPDSIGA